MGFLSAKSFNLYINNMIKDISSISVGCKLETSSINILISADDTVVFSNSLENFNEIYIKLKAL